MPLDVELATFNRMKDELIKTYRNKYALIHGEDFVSAYDTPANAYSEGLKRFGKESFLVKRITETEEVYRNHALDLGLIHAHI